MKLSEAIKESLIDIYYLVRLIFVYMIPFVLLFCILVFISSTYFPHNLIVDLMLTIIAMVVLIVYYDICDKMNW